ncbi:GAF domain-containing sensor histidine kinase [Gordonia phthalatica]|uniref:Diguanylate phosphodiesterase n=1 Tax=Gordonia phthalatica TaxID=1136941 RepID=A0A0N9NFV2_9ACTN|nr:GAF domain-containing sensor histidine kinase [Gordonia phthalatica]ALG84553.1 diguanylate phosphodiesterase [Gordonia phthalatica]
MTRRRDLAGVHAALDALADASVGDPTTMRDLLEAVLLVGRGLELDQALQRIAEVAADALDARYCAVGVRGPELSLQAFVHTGISPEIRATMGPLPVGRGVLGELLHHPEVLRIRKLSDHPASIGFPPNHPPMDTFLGAPIIVRDELFGSIYLTEKQGAPEFTPLDEKIVAVLAVAVGIAVDNSRAFERAQARLRWMQVIADRGSEPLAGTDLADTLDGLCRDVSALTGAVDVFIVNGSEVVGHTGAMPCVEDLFAFADPDDDAASGRLVVRQLAPGSQPWLRRGASWVTIQPLQGGVGDSAIVVTRVDRRYWTGEEVAGLQGTARVASLALAYADQQQLTHDMQLLEDRHRIARDLHDLVIQRLFAIGMSVQTMQAARQAVDCTVIDEERLEQVITDLDGTIAQIRTSIFDLQGMPGHGGQVTLRRRVLDVVAEVAAHAPIVPSVAFVGPVDTLVPDALAPHIEAVLREGISNALRHSGAGRIGVRIVADDVVTVEVSDDGRGIPPTAEQSGLANLTRRADTCDGNFTITSSPSSGTTLTWTAPLH